MRLPRLPHSGGSVEVKVCIRRAGTAPAQPTGTRSAQRIGAGLYQLAQQATERFGINRRNDQWHLQEERHGDATTRSLPEQVDEAVRLYAANWSLARIGERMNVNSTTVLNRLRGRGVRTRDAQARKR